MTNEDALKEGEALSGMLTVRDALAMAALTGLLADHSIQVDRQVFAYTAYGYADAMLIERAKERG